MAQVVEVKFEREGAEGIVPSGIYLLDAAKRLGIRFEADCIASADVHYCSVTVQSGSNLMSGETQAETRHFQRAGRRKKERLACQVRIEKPGEVVIMTEEKATEATPKTETAEDMNEQYRKEFADMPLEKKIASLVHLETLAFSETVSFIFNSPFKVADKIMDVMAEFGFKKEEQQKNAARPEEHAASPASSEPVKGNGKKPKAARGSDSGDAAKKTSAD
jgi:ferredoxin